VQRDPVLALDGGPRGTELVERFLASAGQHLTLNGLAALEVGAGQTEYLADLMRRAGMRDVAAVNDLSRRDRFLFGRSL
jgi:release factor glutamine methyltransferase